ncbi:flagellar hook-length control protein FliK [Pseudomonas fluorescens]|uniref:flagellar hook-length control protein FliK n=1 Tax=Pseudomonas fluorescens TaxID=294 RepID=UPI00177A9A73|nr:flagellar hook-length control protein FliK [Pseudomonas fluorescens]MBD8097834.1 flagellar hook-length control protein FliK [Pseudomonas fluorescens]MBD8773755.1 flagellar hook-length control protein FliK [Pseudomonas fluorescens]MBD8778002.1 flagellar hook-length control protein FliK [Pseudomonas fluorescens]MBD8793730.1 flagellar hook-length control protein FliK [Pseudomonas fluorescens]
MPVAPNSLLQAAPAAKPQAPAATLAVAAADPRDKGPGFAQVFANQGAKPTLKTDSAPGKSSPATADNPSAASTPAVADSGNSLPAKPSDTDKAAEDTPADPSQAQLPTSDTPVDPALIATVTPVAVPLPTPASAVAVEDDTPQPVAAAVTVIDEASQPAFDPEADPLDAMPAVRLAMEQGGHVSAGSQAPQKAAPGTALDQPTAAQNFAAGLATMVDQQATKDSTDTGGEKAFGALIDDGLKDLKDAGSDTRVDDFANRLAALTQAATPKTANALPPVVNAPLAMHQSGWTEEVVNRVMYLSSASLKSAEIQLQPAELGRLDIKVNMTPDQQAQVSFMSGHAVVREALESQSGRLREMFAQQGMGQVDVNVSDQSRGQEQQQQQSQARGVGASVGRGGDSAGQVDVAEAVAPVTQTVIGSSAVDYYA